MRLAALESLLQFQSPIRRGRRCNELAEAGVKEIGWKFQSPICRGRRCNELAEAGVKEIGWKFQSPICRGRRCNRRYTACDRYAIGCFSPLFVGAGVAMVATTYDSPIFDEFQSPICRGRRCNQSLEPSPNASAEFQSPICRGRRCNQTRVPVFGVLAGFSPLFVGAGVAMAQNGGKFHILPQFC